jgi:hypothetical protein
MTMLQQDAAAVLGSLLLITTLCGGQERSVPKPVSEVKCIVADATGAVIPHSEVVFNGETSPIIAHTGMDGSVNVELPIGRYTATAKQNGFVTSKPVDFQINAPTPFIFRVVLQVDSIPSDGGGDGPMSGVPTTASDLPSVITPASVHNVSESAQRRDCTTNHFVMHKTPYLCGKVQIASGDIGVSPAQMGLDDRVDVELRDRNGRLLKSKQLTYKSDVPFCFSEKPKGRYAIAFVLYQSGKPQPAAVFPTKYTANSAKECNAIYLVPPVCSN